MENHKEACEICMHPISNPICVSCYLKQVRLWLEDFGLGKKEIKISLKKIISRLPKETLNEHKCILCRKETVSVCMYCSFLKTSEILLKLDAPKEHLRAFQESSNFAFEEDS